MAETRRLSSASPSSPRPRVRPRLPHPPRDNMPVRIQADDTPDLQSPGWETELPRPAGAAPEEKTVAAPVKPVRRAVPPPRSRRERAALGTLLLGLALNALALLRSARLSPSDLLLGGTVLLSGLTLLALMEIYRRT